MNGSRRVGPRKTAKFSPRKTAKVELDDDFAWSKAVKTEIRWFQRYFGILHQLLVVVSASCGELVS